MPNFLRTPCDTITTSIKSSADIHKNCEKWVLISTILGSSMAFIDGTIVNLILPALQDQMHATVGQIQWVIEIYALFSAALLIVGGSLGDLYGHRLVFLTGVFLFTLSSIWCGLASTISQLILARAFQGIGAALLIPGSLAIITATIPEERRGQAIGIWSGYTAITTALGPLIGGWLTQHASWRWVFFINVPLAIAIFVSMILYVPESRSNFRAGKLDILGAFLVVMSFGAIVFGLIESQYNYLTLVLIELVGVFALIAFIFVETQVNSPMVPFEMFKSRNFSGANLITLFLYAALYGILFFLPLDLIQIQGYTATEAGAALLPLILLMFLLSKWAGGLVIRLGARLPLIIGPAIMGFGLALLSRIGIAYNYWTSFFIPIFILGLGMAISVAPLTTVVMNSITKDHVGAASGVNNAISRIAGLLAIAIFGLIMTNIFNHQLMKKIELSSLSEDAKIKIINQIELLAGIKTNNQETQQLIQESFLSGYQMILWIAVGLSLTASLCASTLIQNKSEQNNTF